MAAEPEQLEEVTLACPDCPETFTGPARGVGSAPWKVGTHRYQRHGYRNANAVSKSDKGKAAPAADEPTTVAVLREIGSGARASGRKGVPTATDLAQGLGRGIQVLSVTAAAYAAETDESLTTEAQRDALVHDLMLSPRGATDIMEPIANAFAPTSINKRYGRAIIDNVDAVASIGELAKLALRWRRYFRVREERRQFMTANGVQVYPAGYVPANAQPAQVVEQPQPAPQQVVQPQPQQAPVAGPTFAPAGQVVQPQSQIPVPPVEQPVVAGEVPRYDVHGNPVAPTAGTLLTPDMVAAMRQGR